jgi:hypothetical protein
VVDTASLLRDLHIFVEPGHSADHVVLRSQDGVTHIAALAPSVDTVAARTTVGAGNKKHPVYVGRRATSGVLARAQAGEFGLLVEQPAMLIVDGTTYAQEPEPDMVERSRPSGRPAWIRWAVARCLILASAPRRQVDIASQLGTSQQAVSLVSKSLGPLVTTGHRGLVATDKGRLLDAWAAVYPGPGGQRFGWYGLDPAVPGTEQAVRLAADLGADPIVSGDVAADVLSPWKLPSTGLVYLQEPVDLAGEGFVPVSLAEANLVTVLPRDPTLWCTVGPDNGRQEPRLADPVMVYGDLLRSRDLDNAEAAAHLKLRILGEQA